MVLNLGSTEGQRVYLQFLANLGEVGRASTVTGEIIHPDFAEIAVRACRTLPGAHHSDHC